MIKYIIDANLPYYFSLWGGEEYQNVIDIDSNIKDSKIWKHENESLSACHRFNMG